MKLENCGRCGLEAVTEMSGHFLDDGPDREVARCPTRRHDECLPEHWTALQFAHKTERINAAADRFMAASYGIDHEEYQEALDVMKAAEDLIAMQDERARARWAEMQKGGAFLSGTRPLPDTAGEVAQPAEFPVGWNEMPPEDVLRAEAKVSGWMREHRIKEWALGHSASRDMVAALRAEVAWLKDALIDREIERNQLLAGMQEELTAQRLLERNDGYLYLGNGVEVAIAGTTARVAELEAVKRAADNMAYAALFVIGNQGNEANAIDGLEIARDKYMAVSAPGKEPTSE